MKHPLNNNEFYLARQTSLGNVRLKWKLCNDQPRVTRILLTNPEKEPATLLNSCLKNIPRSAFIEITEFLDQIEAFAGGEDIHFSLEILRLCDCSEFQKKVLTAEAKIPRGGVSTYQHIAAHLEIPGGARAVGTALATNPFPLVIPCHRVVRSDGSLGGFQGGLPMKKKLLEMEGIRFDLRGRVENPDAHCRGIG